MAKNSRQKVRDDALRYGANQVGNIVSRNVQVGSDASMRGMDVFLKKAAQLRNVDYEQSKGNLFEYIEAAKLNTALGNKGSRAQVQVTDAKKSWGGPGEPHAPDDFRIIEGDTVILRGQAKVNNDPNRTARMITDKKYHGMQRIVARDKYEEVKAALERQYQNGEISQATYEDTMSNLVRETTHPSGVGSGGTTTSELKKAHGNPEAYATRLKAQQYGREIVQTGANMAVANMIITGVSTSVLNLCEVYQDRKELSVALKEIGVTTAKAGGRGLATGSLSSVLRIFGKEKSIPFLADSAVAVTMAGALIDCGVALRAYSKGELSGEETVTELQNTAIKSVATIYLTKSIELAVGAANPFLPMAIYTLASYAVTTTREIIKNAKLNAEEYERMEKLYLEASQQMKDYRQILQRQMEQYVAEQDVMLDELLDVFQVNLTEGGNYDLAIHNLVDCANRYGIALQHVDFPEFQQAMLTEGDFVLR